VCFQEKWAIAWNSRISIPQDKKAGFPLFPFIVGFTAFLMPLTFVSFPVDLLVGISFQPANKIL